MVNLRYHIVSLVAVFLALAVGVVLGAGPLQTRISNTGESDAQRVVALEDQVSIQESLVEESDAFISAVSAKVAPDTLTGTKAALVLLPGTPVNDATVVEEALQGAGAEIIGAVELTPGWASNAKREYRDSLAGPLASHLEGSTADMTGDQILATALMQTLTSSSKELDLAKQILSDADNPLVVADSYPNDPADAIVLVGPLPTTVVAEGSVDQTAQSDTTEQGLDDASDQALVALGSAAGQTKGASVVVGSAQTPEDFIAIIRDAGVEVNTVDQGGTTMGNLNTVLALVSSSKGAYGQGIGATSPLAPLPTK